MTMMKRMLTGSEKGFTLVELLAAVVIMGLLGLAIGGVLIQLQRSNRITQEMTAVRQVQAAGDRVSFDGLQAQSTEFGSSMTDNAGFLRLFWIGEWNDNNGYNVRTRSIVYTLVASGDQYQLLRSEDSEWTIDGATTFIDESTVVARNLEPGAMSCGWIDTTGDGTPDNETYSFRVVSTVGAKTEARTYDITPRPAY